MNMEEEEMHAYRKMAIAVLQRAIADLAHPALADDAAQFAASADAAFWCEVAGVREDMFQRKVIAAQRGVTV